MPDRQNRLFRYLFSPVAAFFVLHAVCLSAPFQPVTTGAVALGLATYAIRIFGIGAGYHRYFSHRSYSLGRVTQFAMAFLAQTSAQKGVLWWAAHHRHHHRHSDDAGDVHSPVRSGFWWSHLGWIVSGRYDEYDAARIADFARFPELRWLDRYHWFPAALMGATIYGLWGWTGFFWGFVVSTVVLYHCTFSINSLAHVWGRRRFETRDNSRNNWLLALLTFGEGWHNNHHWDMQACRQGRIWWELDITYMALRCLSLLGLARNIREPRAISGRAA